MGAIFQVKRCFRAALLTWAGLATGFGAATPPPEARDILRAVRTSQTAQNVTLKGQIRTGPATVPFRMTFAEGTVSYQFTNPTETVVLKLGEKEARLSDVTKGGSQRVAGARFAEAVRGSDLTYEDLSLRFLYWSRASVEGEETKLLRKCWIVRVEAPSGSDSAYGQVRLWVEEESGTLLQAEAFDKAGKFARRFKVISGQKINGVWYLKQMRIEAPGGASKDPSPTYLEVSGLEN